MNYTTYKQDVIYNKKSTKMSFNEDGRLYYVYRIIDNTNQTYYYGSRICKQQDIILDFWSYCTSSCRKKEIQLNKKDFSVKILKTFSNYNDCIIYESYLHQKFDVRKHPSFWNKSNQTPWDFLPDRRGMINCKTITGKPVYISCEEYRENKEKYKSYSSDKVTAFNKSTKKFEQIHSKVFYDNRNLYLSMTDTFSFSDESKKKMSESARKRGYVKHKYTFNVYNSYDEIIYKSIGNFKSLCELNNLPFTALKTSYQHDGEPIYTSFKQGVKKRIEKLNWLQYSGWYCKKIY